MTTPTPADIAERAAIIAALAAWIRQRPGLDYGNYGDPRSYRAELRGIARDKRDAETLLRHLELTAMPAAILREAFPRAFSGRLEWDGKRLSYCTGQYWPTEYRKAACAVLASALWRYWCDDMATADMMRTRARRWFGRGLASRWFN